MIPIKYYLPSDIGKATLDFQDASKGKLVYFYNLEGENLALIVTDIGEVKETLASYVKVIGDDTKRVLARCVEEVKNMKEYYVPQSLHLQFVKDLENLKNFE